MKGEYRPAPIKESHGGCSKPEAWQVVQDLDEGDKATGERFHSYTEARARADALNKSSQAALGSQVGLG